MMGKLMKYEWKKGWFTKLVILVITAIVEAGYLIGVFAKNEDWYTVGIIGLVACTIVGIVLIGIEGLTAFSRDLNTKQSYMLFLTPHTSYEILGAKVLMNAGSLLAAGIFFAALAALDISVGISYICGVKELLQILKFFTQIEIEWKEVTKTGLLVFSSTLAEWLYVIVAGDLAIVLAATVLAGKKGSGFVSFLIFLCISGVMIFLMNQIPDSLGDILRYWLEIGSTFVLTAVLYGVTGWVMERKLSV